MVVNWNLIIFYCNIFIVIGWSLIALNYILIGSLIVISTLCIIMYNADKENVHNY